MSEFLAQPGVPYLLGAYGVSVVGFVGYRLWLARERRRLRGDAGGPEAAREAASPNRG